jgi:hypothetical protein
LGRAGILIACGGLLVSGITFYHTSQQTAELRRQTLEFERQNNLEEVSQGLSLKKIIVKIPSQ